MELKALCVPQYVAEKSGAEIDLRSGFFHPQHVNFIPGFSAAFRRESLRGISRVQPALRYINRGLIHRSLSTE